jgi:hypothetical protein
MDEDFSAVIPSDVEREDRILAGLTARQVAILAVAAVTLWLAYLATRTLIPLLVFAPFAFVFGSVAAVLALGRRDGLSLDRLLLAAIRQQRTPRKVVLAPDGVTAPPAWVDSGQPVPLPAPLRLPARAISDQGVIDLGPDGVAVICEATTVSFALRTPTEQASLVSGFGRWLNSLSGPAQILIRAEDVDITPLVNGLRDRAAGLPHPALETAALDHADFLTDLATNRDLLRRRVLIVLCEPRQGSAGQRPASDGGAGQRVLRRAEEAARSLASADIAVRVLNGGQATAALAACCNPWQVTPAASAQWRAAPSEVITGGTP